MAYIERRNLKIIQPFLPEEPGLRAHVMRVAGLSLRAGKHRGFSEEQLDAMEMAGLLHHFSTNISSIGAATELLNDLGIKVQYTPANLPAKAEEIVRTFRGEAPAVSDAKFVKEAAGILEGANLFDEQIENLPYDELRSGDSIQELVQSGLLSRSFASAVESFRVLSRKQLDDTAKRLPVFPKAAMDALRMARDPNAGTREIEKAISRDPVLAGETIHLANSGLFGTWHPVNSLSMALARVGTIAAGKLIAAAAVRRCFVSGNLHQLWSHSFEAGESASFIAMEAVKLDAGEAYLAGLVHDVGRLTFELSPAASEIRAWQEAGFPAVYAELIVSGTDHAVMGAEILKKWLFPDAVVEAVLYHHRPELTSSRLAAVVYASEDLDETLPSCARDHIVSKRLDLETITQLRAVG